VRILIPFFSDLLLFLPFMPLASVPGGFKVCSSSASWFYFLAVATLFALSPYPHLKFLFPFKERIFRPPLARRPLVRMFRRSLMSLLSIKS